MLTDEDFDDAGLAKGFVGPQGLKDVLIIADPTVTSTASEWIAGANRRDAHVTHVQLGRDFEVGRWADVVTVEPGDDCPRCETGTLEIERAIEVGHTFQLGTRYSEPLKATFVDEDGIERPFMMGCYGIGVSRIIASVAEQHHDDAGLTWPRALAPFEAVVIPTNMDRADVVEAAEGVYAALTERGTASVLDDRAVSAGVKFADADLIGYPLQVIVGTRGLDRGVLEVKIRTSGERREVNASAAADGVLEILSAL
jgi:prolyl-tRNA synthetase